jgi:hypothetical protein
MSDTPLVKELIEAGVTDVPLMGPYAGDMMFR